MRFLGMIALLTVCLSLAVSCGDDGTKTIPDNAQTPDESAVTDDTVTDETVTDETTVDDQSDQSDQTDQTDQSATDETVTDDTVVDNETPDEEQPDEDTAAGFNFNGQWAMLNFTTSNVETTITGLPNTQKSTSTTSGYALVGLLDNGDGTVSAMGTTCDMQINSGSNLIDIIVSENYIAHLSPTIWDFTVLPDRGGNGYDVSATDVLTMNGLKDFNDPMNDPLPTDKNDPKVWDQDDDDHPGMTIDCVGHIFLIFDGPGTMYTVQRTIIDMVGETSGNDRIEGGLIWESEQVVLEASNNALMSDKTITPDYPNSWFKMVRVDNSWTCAEIKANKDTLFPQ